jgi:hypothetical protein
MFVPPLISEIPFVLLSRFQCHNCSVAFGVILCYTGLILYQLSSVAKCLLSIPFIILSLSLVTSPLVNLCILSLCRVSVSIISYGV